MASALRPLTERERAIAGKYSAQHGAVRGLEQPIADDDGNISSPLLRVPLLIRLEQRGTISRREAEAGERFAAVFRIASLDALKAADMARVPLPPGRAAGDLPTSAERCRRQVSEAMNVLGGGGSSAGSALWHVVGLEWTLNRWAATARRPHGQACGILIGALAALAAHFASGRRR